MILNEEIWGKLALDSPKGEKITARLAMPDASRKLYAGFDSGKKRHFLIALEEKEEGYYDVQSRGFSIVTRDLVIKDSDPKRYIDIICHDNSAYVIFNIIGSEIGVKIDTGIPKEVIANVVSKWRNFWGRQIQDLLTYNEITGLFAELWFLYYWLIPRVDKLEAINRWRGPFLSRHDFELNGMSIEVKATTSVQSRIHRIHGIEQLSPPTNGRLFLFSLRLREEQGASNDLPNIIELCREKLKDNIDALSKFENVLAMVGYSPVYDEEYSKYKFRVVDQKLFDVTHEFPCLTEKSFIQGIPSGISAIEYTLNLDGYDNLCIAKSPEEFPDLQFKDNSSPYPDNL